MILDSILWEKKSELVLWDKDNWRIITARSYVENVLMIPVLQPFWNQESKWAGHFLWLMADGASAHRAAYTLPIQEEYEIPKLD